MMKDKYKVLLISCWALLLVCCILKLLGLNIFSINCQNATFITICDYIDNRLYLKIILSCIVALILNSLYILAVLKQRFYTKLQALMFIPLIILMSVIGWYSPPCQIVLNLIFYTVLPILFKVDFKRVLLSLLLLIAFQVISITLKNIGAWHLNTEHTLTAIILQFDTLIMVLLYYLYSNKQNGGV